MKNVLRYALYKVALYAIKAYCFVVIKTGLKTEQEMDDSMKRGVVKLSAIKQVIEARNEKFDAEYWERLKKD